ncbi:unnamed protein product [Lathyrus oleraceus]|uniref:SP-RING-type domain-containing protein n=1 Tax=Pisum sativum TaxID=3888 RepID=A0A9D5B8W9_PEA|nr:E4 SUMO-protein ligase PIAL2 [Pisum sativum]KAI5440002.1 hypothetical protein KIW84_025386 [Pisum sativum]
MESNTSSAMPPDLASMNGTTNPVSPSLVNLYRITKVLERLAFHFQPGNRSDPFEFFNLCLSLSRGIDYALANGEPPPKANDLPTLMKQMYQRKTDELSLAAVMVLMISVKNACKIGWFQKKESEELLTIADEIGKIYCTLGNVSTGPSSSHSAVLTIMERFYPKLKLGPIIVSIEAQPGYGASAVDFHITKNNVHSDRKIWLLVAQTDNIETSACLISPQQVNFLLNGKGIDTRTNFRMDPGPQMPTNVTSVLKFGTNLLQAVGQFNGHYIILIAYMSVASLPEHPVLPPDYVQPAVTSVDSDSDIIEGASRFSLNCPISFTRIKTPVKGRSCKHFQCFDFDNFIKINSKRPSWRCPHCNQNVSYTEIRLDRNMIEILEKVAENIVEVTVHADGSWQPVLEKNHDVDKIQNKVHNCEKEQTEQQESTHSPDTFPHVVDLTNKDNDMDIIMDTCETADRKPSQGSAPTSVQIEDDFWAGLYIANSRSDTPTVGVTDLPVLADAVSPALIQEAEGHDNISAVHNQFPALSNLQMMNYMNSFVSEYGRSSLSPRHIHRTPVAVQALPVQSQPLGPQQNSVTNLDSLITSSPSATHVSLSNSATADPYNAILSDAERQQLFSRSPLNTPQVSAATQNRMPAVNMPAPTHNRVPPVSMSATTLNRAPSHLQNQQYRAGILNDFRNSHLQQTLNPRAHPPMQPLNAHRSHIQQGISQANAAGGAANSQQARVMASSHVARQGEQRGPPVQAVSRTDELFNSQPDQNWRPTSRMRGSLSGQQLTEDVRQRLIMPSSQEAQSSRPQGPPQPGRTTSQLNVLIANSRNAHNPPRP